MHDWTTITTVFGEYVHEPIESEMRRALEELFSSADADHPDAWIECGSKEGPLYCISVFASGYALCRKYSDGDMTLELASKKIEDVDLETALTLWRELASGDQ